MSARRRATVPLAAGLAAAVAAFAVVVVTTRGDAPGRRTTAAVEPGSAATGRSTTVDSGRVVFAEMGCGGCHRLAAAGSEGGIGPDLDPVLAVHTRGSLVAKISDPGAGSLMPGDYAGRMDTRRLRALVAFLLDVRDRASASG